MLTGGHFMSAHVTRDFLPIELGFDPFFMEPHHPCPMSAMYPLDDGCICWKGFWVGLFALLVRNFPYARLGFPWCSAWNDGLGCDLSILPLHYTDNCLARTRSTLD